MATDWYVKSGVASIWTANTAYNAGDRVVSTTSKTATQQFRVYECTTPGTSHLTTEPAWNTTVGGTQADNTVTWTVRNPTTAANANHFLNRLLMGNVAVIAGDTIYVSDAHNESITGNSSNFPATLGDRNTPTFVLCVTDASFGSTNDLSTGAVVSYSGLINSNSYIYYYGIHFKTGDGVATTQNFNIGGSASVSRLVYEQCNLDLASTGGSSLFAIGETSIGTTFSVDFINCTFTFGAAGAQIQLQGGQINMFGCTLAGTAPTALMKQGGNNINRILQVFGCDISLATGIVYDMTTLSTTADGSTILFDSCRMGSGFTMWNGTPTSASGIFKAINCSVDTANYHFSSKGYYGTEDDDIATYMNGDDGATDGTTPFSRKLVATANVKRTQPLYSDWWQIWDNAPGSHTITVEIFHDSATPLKDNEVWVEVFDLESASYTVAAFVTDASDIRAAGASQASSANTWTNSATNPSALKCSVTRTTALKGRIKVRIALAKASGTVWYNPRIKLT